MVGVALVVAAAVVGALLNRAGVPIHADAPPRALPPRDGVANKNAFRAALGFGTF